MQEQMNKAMASLSETVGQDVPTLDEVRDKIEARYAKAKGMAELTESSVESRMLEVEQASMNSEAQARLAQIRSQLGLAAGRAAARSTRAHRRHAPADGTPAPGTGAGTAPSAARRRPRSGPGRDGDRTRRGDAAAVGVGPHPGPGPTTPGSTPSCWRAATAATSSTGTGTGGSRRSSPTSTRRRHPFHVAVENWRHDLNIGTVVRNANAFVAAAVHIVGRRRWNRRGAMVTERYQHVEHHPTIDDLVAWAAGEDLPLVGIDNLPGSVPLETVALPRALRARVRPGGPGPVGRGPGRLRARCARSPVRLDPLDQRRGGLRASPCTPGSASTLCPDGRVLLVAKCKCFVAPLVSVRSGRGGRATTEQGRAMILDRFR